MDLRETAANLPKQTIPFIPRQGGVVAAIKQRQAAGQGVRKGRRNVTADGRVQTVSAVPAERNPVLYVVSGVVGTGLLFGLVGWALPGFSAKRSAVVGATVGGLSAVYQAWRT